MQGPYEIRMLETIRTMLERSQIQYFSTPQSSCDVKLSSKLCQAPSNSVKLWCYMTQSLRILERSKTQYFSIPAAFGWPRSWTCELADMWPYDYKICLNIEERCYSTKQRCKRLVYGKNAPHGIICSVSRVNVDWRFLPRVLLHHPLL
jgi:hypothetical protein